MPSSGCRFGGLLGGGGPSLVPDLSQPVLGCHPEAVLAKCREQKEDALKYRPNLDLLVSKLDQDTEATGGVYRLPMMAPVAMEEDIRPKYKWNKERAEKESRRRASGSAYMKEIAIELEGKPEEVQEIIGTESKEMMHEKASLDAHAKEEEELFTHFPLSRVEWKKLIEAVETIQIWVDGFGR
ncbi:unnamed protein product [Calypogeia fissa]